MKIGIIPLNFKFLGGAEEYSIQLYESLKDLGLHAELATCIFNQGKFEFEYPIKIFNENNFLELNNFDLLIITSPLFNEWKYLNQLSVKKVYIAHDRFCLGLEKNGFPFNKLKNIEHLVFIRERVMEEYKRNFSNLPYTFSFIRHGINLSNIEIDMKKKKNIAINTARITPQKSQKLILDAIPLMKGKMIFYGNAIATCGYLTLLKKHQYYQQAKFTFGFKRYNKKKIYMQAKVLVDATLFKRDGGGTQYTFLEAMKWGCVPVVPSIWEGELKNERNILVADSPREIADATNYVMENDEILEQISSANIKLLNKWYDRRYMAIEFKKIIDDICL